MPIIQSAKKRVRITATKTVRNRQLKSRLRTAIKNFEKSAEAGDREQTAQVYRQTQKIIDQSVAKGILHKNNAARKKARLSRLYNEMA